MKNITFRKSLTAAAVAASLGFPALAVAQDTNIDSSAEEVEERIQVTGSRIKRTDLEGDVPVTVIDRAQIELSGDISVADLIRDTTFNTAGSFRPQSGSSAQGTASVDMRGLGSSRTLVLIDGRRLTMSPSTGSDQDLNAIPLGAVERIEILSDGASAIYGSDAIGGVINVITRQDYNGFEMTVGEGGVSIPEEGGDRENGNILFGASGEDTRILAGVSWNKREIVFENAFPWVEPGASTYGNNFDYADFTNGYQAIPGACNADNFYINGNLCAYDFNATNATEASSANESLFVKANHNINDDWEIYANASVAKTSSFGRYAPVPDTNFFQGSAIDEDSYNNPTNPNAWYYDPNNPDAVSYDQDLVGDQQPVHLFHRFAAVGNRDNNVDNENIDLLVGSTGYVGDVELDFGLRRVRNKTYEIGRGYLAAGTAWDLVNDFNPGYDSEGNFNPDNQTGYNIAQPFQNSEEVLSGSAITTSRISQFNIDEAYASAAFDIAEINGGMIQSFVGMEYRSEEYSDQYDSQSEAGLVGGSSGNSAGGGRNVRAAFFETLFPFTMDFEVTLAGRYDDYSDYGSDFSPKVSFRWQPHEDVVLRGSWGEGFRAPTLPILTQKTAFSADSVQDPQTCTAAGLDADCEIQINAYRIANPDLSSEQSTQISAGVAWNVIDNFDLSLDYYDIEIDDRIAFYSSQDLINAAAAGDPIPAGLGVERRPNGSIARIDTGYGNEGTLSTNGLDFKARANYDFGQIGAVTSDVTVSWVNDYTIDGGRNRVGDPSLPEYRLNWNNVYNYEDFEFGYVMNVIGDQERSAEANVEGTDLVGYGTYTTHNFQASYNFPWNGKLTLGMQNAFEKKPTLIDFDGRDYNYDLYDGYGRITYFNYNQKF
ncbi:MAG: TonB-dependent receptor plug domain-containing protein [Pseudomonadota bacterium]